MSLKGSLNLVGNIETAPENEIEKKLDRANF